MTAGVAVISIWTVSQIPSPQYPPSSSFQTVLCLKTRPRSSNPVNPTPSPPADWELPPLIYNIYICEISLIRKRLSMIVLSGMLYDLSLCISKSRTFFILLASPLEKILQSAQISATGVQFFQQSQVSIHRGEGEQIRAQVGPGMFKTVNGKPINPRRFAWCHLAHRLRQLLEVDWRVQRVHCL